MNIALDRNNNVIPAASQQNTATSNLNEAPLAAAATPKDPPNNDVLAAAQAPSAHSNVRVQAGNGQTQILDSSCIGGSTAESILGHADLDPKIISTAKKLKLTNEQLKNLIESSTNDELIQNLAQMVEKSVRRDNLLKNILDYRHNKKVIEKETTAVINAERASSDKLEDRIVAKSAGLAEEALKALESKDIAAAVTNLIDLQKANAEVNDPSIVAKIKDLTQKVQQTFIDTFQKQYKNLFGKPEVKKAVDELVASGIVTLDEIKGYEKDADIRKNVDAKILETLKANPDFKEAADKVRAEYFRKHNVEPTDAEVLMAMSESTEKFENTFGKHNILAWHNMSASGKRGLQDFLALQKQYLDKSKDEIEFLYSSGFNKRTLEQIKEVREAIKKEAQADQRAKEVTAKENRRTEERKTNEAKKRAGSSDSRAVRASINGNTSVSNLIVNGYSLKEILNSIGMGELTGLADEVRHVALNTLRMRGIKITGHESISDLYKLI